MSNYVIRLKDVSVSFAGARILDHVNFEFTKGRVTALVGPNGAGKTTVFNLICGLVKPDEGQVFYLGRDITGQQPWENTRLGIGRTFQDMLLFDNLSILQNVLVVLQNVGEPDNSSKRLLNSIFPRRSEDEERQLLERSRAALEQVGLAAKADEPATHLSYGEQKLLSLARLLAAEPDVLLLDEPVAWLHAGMAEVVLRLIREQAARGRTVVVIEHDQRFLDDLAAGDYVYRLEDGRATGEALPAAGVKAKSMCALASFLL